jgi:hypothetical protein
MNYSDLRESLGINSTNGVKDLYNENYKALKKNCRRH